MYFFPLTVSCEADHAIKVKRKHKNLSISSNLSDLFTLSRPGSSIACGAVIYLTLCWHRLVGLWLCIGVKQDNRNNRALSFTVRLLSEIKIYPEALKSLNSWYSYLIWEKRTKEEMRNGRVKKQWFLLHWASWDTCWEKRGINDLNNSKGTGTAQYKRRYTAICYS